MKDGIIVQYLGFQAKRVAREYSFQVREGCADRAFTFKIANDAFLSRPARYQDGPDICAQRLQAELVAHANHPSETDYVITSAALRLLPYVSTVRVGAIPGIQKSIPVRQQRPKF